jgi:O-antigen ligase
MILALVLTNSRAAILTLLVGVSFIFFKENKKYLYRLFLAMIIGLSLLLIEPISDALNLYLRLERISTGRDYILETVFNIISNNPIIGAGPAASKFEMYNYLPYMFGTHQEYFLSKLINQIEFGHAHNFYLFFYTDLGILGFVVSLAIPYVFFKLSSKIIKKINNLDGMIYPLVLGIQASGIALFLRGIFEWGGIFSYGTLSYDLPFWWIFIMLIFIYQKSIMKQSKISPKYLHNS